MQTFFFFFFLGNVIYLVGLPGWLSDKEYACNEENEGDAAGSSPGSGRYPGGRHGNPLQYPCIGESH